MANIQITQLPNAQPLTGQELVPLVQQGVTVKTTAAALAGSPVQTQTFLTLNQEPTLINSRALSGGTGVGLLDGGALSTLQITLNGTSGALEGAGTGIIVKTGSGAISARSVAVSGTGLAISNGSGVSGNPTISLNGLISAIAQVGGTGLLAFQNGTTAGGVLIAGTANQISVANGNGQGGNPTISMVSDPIIPGTGGMVIPLGTTVQQPSGTPGQFRFNTDTQTFDGYASGSWKSFSLASGVTTFSAGSTGLTPASATSGVVTLGGTLNVSSGGTGANTLTGYLVGNGTSAVTAVATIPNAGLTNSSVTYNGVTVALGASGTITAANPNALTIGTGLNGGSYDGSTAVTITIDATVATLTGTQTLTNKTISGASNTLTNIGNGSLTNSAITINGSSVSLGGSITVTATASNALTIGTGLSGGSYNGSTPVTIAIDSTVATLTGTQTLTNKLMSGSSNTFTNIPNGALTNSSVTFNGSTVALGGSATITASTTNALTIGTGLTGTSFNGGSAVTIAIDSTVATLSGTQTLTNKSISGSTNTLTNIPNSALTNSSLTVGSTAISLGATSLTLAGLTSVTLTQDPTLDLQAATKQYVDAKASTGLAYHSPVQAATTQSLAATTGGTVTYNNGASGVGATITLSVALTVLDGYTIANTNRLLIKNEVNQAYNGVYTWATGGTVLTRATDADTYGSGVNQLSQNDYFFVQNGTVNRGSSYVVTTVGTITFGTTAITFAEFSNSQVYTAGTGLTLTGTTFSITNTGVTNGSYGTASSVPTLAINAQGQVTSASNTAIAINGNQITSGTVGSAYISGSYTNITGVGVLTAGTWNATAITDTYLATISTAGKVSNSATTATSANTASAIVARDASGNFSAGTITATLSGNASNVTGVVAFANGGTGETTRQAAIDALAGAVTSGQYLRGNGTDVVMSAIQAADVPTLNQNTTGSAATLTTGRTIAITGDLAYTSPSFNGSTNVTAAGTLATVNSNVGSFTNASVTVNGKGLVTAVSSGTAPVTSVSGTSPVASSGGATPAISLASGYGDTQNPYASKTANFVLAAPNGSAGAPSFRAVVAADIPTLNQNTTGSAGSVTNAVTFNNAGTGDASGTTFNGSAARTISYNTIGAQVAGTYVTGVTATSPVASSGGTAPVISMPAATTSANGYLTSTDWNTFNGKGNGTVTSVSGTGTVSGLSLSGTVTTSGNLTLGGTLSVLPSNFASQTANTFLAAPNGAAGVPTFRAVVAADIPTLNQNTTGTASNVTGIVAVANGGTGTATPSLVAGTNVTITGSFPNQTINASGGGGGGSSPIPKLQSWSIGAM